MTDQTPLTPLACKVRTQPLKYIAPIRGEKVDSVPSDGDYVGLEQIEPWTGKLSGVELPQMPEGGANVFKQGDVLFGKLRPYLAKGWVADRVGFCTTESLVLSPLENADPRYLRYCMLTPEFIDAVNGSTYGSKMPRADWGFIGSVHLPSPNRTTQKLIANFLDEKTARIDALIAEKERLLASLDELWNSRLSWELQAPAAQGASLLPSGWKVLPLKRLCSAITTGRTPSGTRDDCFSDGGLTWVTPGDIQGLFVNSSARRVTEIAVAEDEVRRYPAGSTLLVGIGATVGIAAYAETSVSANQQINVLVPDRKVADPVFLTLLVMAHRDQIRQAAGAATLPIINQEKTGRIQIAVPSLDEQRALREQLLSLRNRVDYLQSHAKEHIFRLREYRSSLISAAVTGQLDVNNFKAAA